MKKYLFLVLIITLYSLTGCEDDLNSSSNEIQISNRTNKITVKNGHLNFPNMESLNAYIKKIETIVNDKSCGLKSGINFPEFEGYNSLANKLEKYHNNSISQLKTNEVKEVSFNPEIQELIIPDEVIHHVVDDKSRVQIADELYQITEVGTFIYKEKNITDFEELYENFNKQTLNEAKQIEEISFNFNNVKFVIALDIIN